MKSSFLVAFFTLPIFLPILAMKTEPCVSESGDKGLCAPDNVHCEKDFGQQNCTEGKFCCGDGTGDEASRLTKAGKKGACDNTRECVDIGGECLHRKQCPQDMRLDAECWSEQKKCVCCKPNCSLNGLPTKICKETYGSCINKTKPCPYGERVIEHGCINFYCKCCAPACERTWLCYWNDGYYPDGYCVNNKWDCPSGVILPDGCIGPHCFCCLPTPIDYPYYTTDYHHEPYPTYDYQDHTYYYGGGK